MLTGHSRRAAVLGSPISHSLSPVLHRAAYRALRLDSWTYGAHEVQAPELGRFVAGLDPSWAGLSLTMPLKEAAFEVADEISDLAREVGAINTLVRAAEGGWRGENTDVYGVSQALRQAGCSRVTSALVLGSGATARSVVAALASLGCLKVTFAVRSTARPQTLDQAARAGLEVDVVALDRSAATLADAEVAISTLPPTAFPLTLQSQNALSARMLSEGRRLQGHLLLDVVYADWPTALAQMVEQAGGEVVSGLELLVHQASEQVRLMTGLRPPVNEMRAAGLAAMGSGDRR